MRHPLLTTVYTVGRADQGTPAGAPRSLCRFRKPRHVRSAGEIYRGTCGEGAENVSEPNSWFLGGGGPGGFRRGRHVFGLPRASIWTADIPRCVRVAGGRSSGRPKAAREALESNCSNSDERPPSHAELSPRWRRPAIRLPPVQIVIEPGSRKMGSLWTKGAPGRR